MFASFQSTPDGLAAFAEPPKLSRSDRGCWPCMTSQSRTMCTRQACEFPSNGLKLTTPVGRRKRKKCCGVKPVCRRCRSSHRRDVCTWPTSHAERRVLSKDANILHENKQVANLSPSSTFSGETGLTLRPMGSLSVLKLAELPPANLPDTVTAVSP